MVIFICQIGLGIGRISIFRLTINKSVFNSLCFGYKAAPDYFQAFSQDLVRICREQGILCKVELDDFLIYADSFESCLNSVNFVGDLFKYFGIKINFSKS